MDYEIVLRPLSEEDGGGWAAIVPDLPGCMGDGETREEALRDVEGAIRSWIETAEELGEEAPKPSRRSEYSGKFTLRMPKSLHEALDRRAKDDGVSLNQTCIHLLAMGLGATRKPKRKHVATIPLSSDVVAPVVRYGVRRGIGPKNQPDIVVVDPKRDTRIAADVKSPTIPKVVAYMKTTDGDIVPFNLITGRPIPVRKSPIQWRRGNMPSKT